MTPLEIDILVHYYCSAADYRDGDLSAPAVQDALAVFLTQGLIEPETQEGWMRKYRTTQRGAAHVMQLCALPLPVSAWVDGQGHVISEPRGAGIISNPAYQHEQQEKNRKARDRLDPLLFPEPSTPYRRTKPTPPPEVPMPGEIGQFDGIRFIMSEEP